MCPRHRRPGRSPLFVSLRLWCFYSSVDVSPGKCSVPISRENHVQTNLCTTPATIWLGIVSRLVRSNLTRFLNDVLLNPELVEMVHPCSAFDFFFIPRMSLFHSLSKALLVVGEARGTKTATVGRVPLSSQPTVVFTPTPSPKLTLHLTWTKTLDVPFPSDSVWLTVPLRIAHGKFETARNPKTASGNSRVTRRERPRAPSCKKRFQ